MNSDKRMAEEVQNLQVDSKILKKYLARCLAGTNLTISLDKSVSVRPQRPNNMSILYFQNGVYGVYGQQWLPVVELTA